MAVWRCTICNYEYDEAVEGTSFEKLPDDWKCPVCDAPKDAFEKIS
jgi:rubredoxin